MIAKSTPRMRAMNSTEPRPGRCSLCCGAAWSLLIDDLSTGHADHTDRIVSVLDRTAYSKQHQVEIFGDVCGVAGTKAGPALGPAISGMKPRGCSKEVKV
jgi:hypothetical protein